MKEYSGNERETIFEVEIARSAHEWAGNGGIDGRSKCPKIASDSYLVAWMDLDIRI